MAFFENITRKVSDTAKAAAKKSGELVEVTKLNMNISSEEDKIKKIYVDIGKAVFDAYSRGEELGAAFKDYCESISAIENNITEMKAKIRELKELKLCPGCNVELDVEVKFCPNCGAKQEVASADYDSGKQEATTEESDSPKNEE